MYVGHGPMQECILSIMFNSFIDHTQYDICQIVAWFIYVFEWPLTGLNRVADMQSS